MSHCSGSNRLLVDCFVHGNHGLSICVCVRQGSGLSPVAGVSSQCSVCSLAPLSTVACLRQITHTHEQMGADLSTHKYTKQGQASWMHWIYIMCMTVCVFMYMCEMMHAQHMFVLSCMFVCTVSTLYVTECVYRLFVYVCVHSCVCVCFLLQRS